MVAVSKRQLVEPSSVRVMVMGADAAWVALVMSGIGAAGGRVSAHGAEAVDDVVGALRRGETERVVVLGDALASRVLATIRDTPSLAHRVLRWTADARDAAQGDGAAAEPSLDALVRMVMGRAPVVGGAPSELDLHGVSAAALLGAAAVLRPTLELTLRAAGRSAGIHLCDGLVRAAGVSTALPRDDRGVAADPSLRLVSRRWPDRAGDTPDERLAEELALVSEYSELFAASAAHRDYLVSTLRVVLDQPWDHLEARGAHAHARGLDLVAALRDVCLDAAPRRLAALVPEEARVVAPGGLPSRLREAFPPRRFGRLYFLLEAPTPVSELAASTRLDDGELRAALVVGLLTGAVELSSAPAEPPEKTPTVGPAEPASEPAPGLEKAPRLGARRVPATTSTGATGRALGQSGEPEARRFLGRLADAAARARREGTRVRVHNTRFEPIGELADDLVLGYRIGHGAMGDVLLGVHCSDANVQKVVAVKRRTGEALRDEARLEMFFDEARLSAGLTHSNVVQTFQLLRVAERYGLVMEFVHGVTAEELIILTGGRPLSPALVAWIGAEVAAGLDYAHRLTGPDGEPLGLVHRDVAPANVMLGVDGGVKLIDFGVANATRRGGPGARSGRASFMAPEVLAYNAVGAGSDQFALGVTLYKLLTGALPFEATPGRGIVDAILTGGHRPVLAARADVPAALAYVIERGMARDPSERFASCDAMRHALLGAVPRGSDERELVATTVQEAAASFLPWELEAIARMRRAAAAIFGDRHARRLAPEPSFGDEEQR